MKTLLLQISNQDVGTITHEVNLEDETWITQLEAFRVFLLAQGYHVDGRIAIVEPDTSELSEHSSEVVNDMFYEQLQDSCWLGEVVSRDAINNKE